MTVHEFLWLIQSYFRFYIWLRFLVSAVDPVGLMDIGGGGGGKNHRKILTGPTFPLKNKFCPTPPSPFSSFPLSAFVGCDGGCLGGWGGGGGGWYKYQRKFCRRQTLPITINFSSILISSFNFSPYCLSKILSFSPHPYLANQT